MGKSKGCRRKGTVCFSGIVLEQVGTVLCRFTVGGQVDIVIVTCTDGNPAVETRFGFLDGDLFQIFATLLFPFCLKQFLKLFFGFLRKSQL